MIKLEDLQPGMRICGLVDSQVVELIQVLSSSSIKAFGRAENVALSVKVVYRFGQTYDDRTIFRRDEDKLFEAEDSLLFGEEAELARLAWQARRIQSAHLFDPYHEVFASNIEVLPHQIEAVYGAMLGRQPLRFLLADDPGAGKTIMAGLYLREMMARASVKRCLIVAPAGLIEQWRAELMDKFKLSFEVFQRDMLEVDPALRQHNHLIAKMDQLKRKEYLELLKESAWDLVICDEAHKMSASFSGGEVNRTQRYRLAEALSDITRHFLLMTATPHNGKEEEFRLFLRLLDQDRYEGRSRTGERKVNKWASETLKRMQNYLDYYFGHPRFLSDEEMHSKEIIQFQNTFNEIEKAQTGYEHYKKRRVDTSEVILRRMKEQLVTLDSKPLYPERKAYTVNYCLSSQEGELYKAVTTYCHDEFNRAERLESGRKNTVGFALTVLQRRLASSPEAIYQSLKSRRRRLEKRLLEENETAIPEKMLFSEEDIEDIEDMTAEEREQLENNVNDQATAATTREELRIEINTLRVLENQADKVRHSNKDSKWNKLREIWEWHIPEMEKDGQQRKLIIFTEHRATLNYLLNKLGELLGAAESVVTIHGGIPQAKRKIVQDRFSNDPKVQILVATDAAGEGINLQFAHLMVNYDLPWNPNRLEQRFGRIHRIGQKEVCHLWNIVTTETREGAVYERLLQKLETIGNDLNGKVFDILGELFEGTPLPHLLKDALRYGDDPRVRNRLKQTIDDAVNHERIRELTEERVLVTDIIDIAKLSANIKAAGADRLQPNDIRDFILGVFKLFPPVISEIRDKNNGCHEIVKVPGVISRFASSHKMEHVKSAYHSVCFDNNLAKRSNGTERLGPTHPLVKATIGWLQGTGNNGHECGESIPIWVDNSAKGTELRELFYVEWAILNAEPANNPIESSARFIEIEGGSYANEVNPSTALAYLAVGKQHEERVTAILSQDGLLDQSAADNAQDYVAQHFVDPHREGVENRETRRIKTEGREVIYCLKAEIEFERMRELQLHWQASRQENAVPLKGLIAQAERRRQELEERLERRVQQLDQQLQISASGITIRRVAIIIPASLLRE